MLHLLTSSALCSAFTILAALRQLMCQTSHGFAAMHQPDAACVTALVVMNTVFSVVSQPSVVFGGRRGACPAEDVLGLRAQLLRIEQEKELLKAHLQEQQMEKEKALQHAERYQKEVKAGMPGGCTQVKGLRSGGVFIGGCLLQFRSREYVMVRSTAATRNSF